MAADAGASATKEGALGALEKRRPRRDTGSAPTGGIDWRAALKTRNGRYLGDERNVVTALRLAPELRGLVQYNEFALTVEFTREAPWRATRPGDHWDEDDDAQLKIWLQERDIDARPNAAADCILIVAKEHRFHPVRDYLAGLTWDGVPRLDTWAVEYLDSDQAYEYLRPIGRKFLVSAVARVMQPGCQADHVLVLEGAQGIGKTSAARTLAVHPSWFVGDIPDVHSKDAKQQLAGHWIIELSELKGVRNSQVEAIKSFLTETIDVYRPPYARRTCSVPRQCVFIGTTNESEYLRDRTGNRRYWPVRCGRINGAALTRDRDQLWAEALHAYRAGEAWHLTDAEAATAAQQQADRVHVSELESDVAAYLARLVDAEVSVRDVLTHGLCLDPGRADYQERAKKLGSEVAEAIERAGWVKVGRKGNARQTVYRRRQGRQG